MSRRAVLLAAILMLVLVACTSDGANTPSPAASIDLGTTTPPPEDTTPPPEDTTPVTNPRSGVNRLVVLDRSGNIVTIDPDGSNPSQVTDDGGAAQYFQPIWSPVTDRLVWGEASQGGFGVGSSAGDGSDQRTVATSSLPFYLNWAPDGSQVGILYGGAQGIVFEVVDMVNFTSTPVGAGSPFYFSWNPDSTEIVVHVGATDFGTVKLGEDIIDMGTTAATYQAPHWTPAGIFHFAEDGLVLVDPGGEEQLLATLPGEPVFFVANAQGTKIAIESFTAEEGDGSTVALSETAEIGANAVSVLDVTTGEVDVASEDTSVGYFWSPDAESLLLLQLTGQAGEVDVSVWKDGETTLLTTMTPPISFFRDVLQFFNQYAQSLQLWSPDSSQVALAGEIEGEEGVWIIPIDGSEPSLIFDGEWVAWSYG
ncbi:MAG TPA: hypothetical protein VJA46_13170 [Acidimicrobiia bacterium]|nr:hypothetical protein [Acidimicrobiia bacterium]